MRWAPHPATCAWHGPATSTSAFQLRGPATQFAAVVAQQECHIWCDVHAWHGPATGVMRGYSLLQSPSQFQLCWVSPQHSRHSVDQQTRN